MDSLLYLVLSFTLFLFYIYLIFKQTCKTYEPFAYNVHPRNSTMRHFPLGLLPPELLTLTFDHLTTSEKCTLAKVSRKFRSVVMQELTRPTKLSEICVDFSKEILVLCQNDLSWIVLTRENNDDGGSQNRESVFLFEDTEKEPFSIPINEPKKRKLLSSVFFINVEWDAYLGEFFQKMNNNFQKRPLHSLRVFLPDGDVPPLFVNCTVRCEELRIKRTNDNNSPPVELMPLIRKTTTRLKVDYILTYSQIQELSLLFIRCTVTGEDALALLQDYYFGRLPKKKFDWTFPFKGDVGPIKDTLNLYSYYRSPLTLTPGWSTSASFPQREHKYRGSIYHPENILSFSTALTREEIRQFLSTRGRTKK